MRPHDWLFVASVGCVIFVFVFRVACRALDMLDGGPPPRKPK